MSEDEPFKVTDRRGRSADADRAESHSVGSAESPPSSTRAPRVEPTSGSSQPRVSGSPGPDLQGLFVMFASSALINLGEAADPVTGQTHVDLEQAREAIDLLLLLRDKTNGNRTEQESRLLEDVLYDLQLRFVRASEEKTPR